MDDAELLAVAKAGDRTAFMRLVKRYHGALFAMARQITGSTEDAEDIALEVIVHVYRNLHKLREDVKFRALCFVICRRECISHLRQGHEEAFTGDEGDNLPVETPIETPVDEIDYEELLTRLPLTAREILIARYFYDLSYEEMAQIFGGTAEAMRTHCFHVRAQVRALKQEDEKETRRIMLGVIATNIVHFPLYLFLERVNKAIAHIFPPLMPPDPTSSTVSTTPIILAASVASPGPTASISTDTGRAQARPRTTVHLTVLKLAGVIAIAVLIFLFTRHLPSPRISPKAQMPLRKADFTTCIAYSPKEPLIAAVQGFGNNNIFLYQLDGTVVKEIPERRFYYIPRFHAGWTDAGRWLQMAGCRQTLASA